VSAINTKVLQCLIKAGCFDGFDISRKALLDSIEHLAELTAREREQTELGQGFLFDDLPSEELEHELHRLGEADERQRLTWEREVLGFYLSGHPLHRYQAQVQRFADCPIAELATRREQGVEHVAVAGLIRGLQVMTIKKNGPNHGRRMGIFTLEDATASIRSVLFPDAFAMVESLVSQQDVPVLVMADLSGDGDTVELRVNEVVTLDRVEAQRAAALRIVLDLDSVDEEMLGQLKEFVLENAGELAVRFVLVRKGEFRALLIPPPPLCINPSPEVRSKLTPLLRKGWFEFEFAQQPEQVEEPPMAALSSG